MSTVYDTITANELERGARKKARQTKADKFRRGLEAQARQETDWVWHSLKAGDFSGGPVSHRHFRAIVKGLESTGLIEVKPAFA